MKLRGLILVLLLLAGLIAAATPASAQTESEASPVPSPEATPEPTPTPESEPAPVEAAVAKEIEKDGKADFWVRFEAEADLRTASRITDWNARGKFVMDTLRGLADRSQAQVKDELERLGTDFKPFWIENTIFVRSGDEKTLKAMAARPEVASIDADHIFDLPEPEPGADLALVDAVEWGIDNINADEVWSTFGVRGEGVVVGSIDTGVQFNHPALVEQYRGNNHNGTFSHDYSWFDPQSDCGSPSLEPCDDVGHGSHTVGTMVGDGGPDARIGVAPAAQWIAAKGCEDRGCSEFALLSSGQWMLAPTDLNGRNPDPSRRPQVVNNSWGGRGGDTWYESTVQAWVASGMFPSFSNGNSGFGLCGTVGAPAEYSDSYGIGAYDIDDNIANFSSLGPGTDGGAKPDISAPGVDVRSSVPGGGYQAFNGTSMASPHLSGAVALLISAAPALLGDVPAIRSVLDGSARDAPDSEECGGSAADNNTFGEGRLDALAAVDSAPRGDPAILSGTVTNAVTGAPVAEAEVLIEGGLVPRRVDTRSDGTYEARLAAGSYDLTVAAYGWEPESASVTLVPGATVTRNFALTPIPMVTVSGTVTDGSGHGWPLYARIDIAGYPGEPVFTDPVTGTYAVDLIPGVTYRATVTALIGGYRTQTRELSLPGDPPQQSYEMAVVGDCRGPGYIAGEEAFTQTFDSPTVPDGWQVVDNAGTGVVWNFHNPGGRDNLTGGDGRFAIIDSDIGVLSTDTELISPSFDLSGAANPNLRFNEDVRTFGDEIFDVDVSIDDGSSWTNVRRVEGEGGTGDLRGPRLEQIALPMAAGEPDVRIRFHYYNAEFEWWWQVDNFALGDPGCSTVPGGLLVGTVTDGLTGDPVDGALVVAGDAPFAEDASEPTPEDQAVADGFYMLFAPEGTQSVTASKKLYADGSKQVTPALDETTRADIALGTGRVGADNEVRATVELGQTTTATLTLTNDGPSQTTFELGARRGGFEVAGAGAPVKREPVAAKPGKFTAADLAAWARAAPDSPGTGAAPWQQIADLPLRLRDNAAAESDGKLYSVGGLNPNEGPLKSLFVYDPAKNSWSEGAPMHDRREKPGAVFAGGKMYVMGGFDPIGVQYASVPTVEVYDPDTGAWSDGPTMLVGSAAMGTALLDGKIYTVGGCTSGECNTTNSVYRLDPANGVWSQLSNYPESVGWLSCGGDEERNRVYCAGGAGLFVESPDTAYSYNPATDQWTPIASLPIPLWGSASDMANGQLVISGGVTGGDITNEGFAYDPFTDSWNAIPPSNTTTYRGAGACGFYRVGGSPGIVDTAERLPTFGGCDPGPVPWMTLSPQTATIPGGGSRPITVNLDASVSDVNQPGTYTASIVIREDTPYAVEPVPVFLEVTPPASWGKVTGQVNGLGRCDVPGTPLGGATVRIDGRSRDFTLSADGTFSAWMDRNNGPVSIEASAPGFVEQVHPDVVVRSGQTTVSNFGLRPDEACTSLSPDGLELDLGRGETATRSLTLQNDGGGELDFTVAEIPYAFDPLPDAGPAPAATGWFQAATMPDGGNQYGHAQCDGDFSHFFVFGGAGAEGQPTDSSLRYDVTTNSWIQLEPLPSAVVSPTAVCEGSRIHVMGGGATTAHHVYDIGSDTWTTATPLPRPVRGAAGGVWNGRIYLAGGDADILAGGAVSTVDVYDIAAGTWSSGPAMPRAAAFPGYVQAGRYVYVAGGWDAGSPADNLRSTQRLDLLTGTWDTGPDLPLAKAALALAATDQAIYAIGGDDGGGSFDDATDHTYRLPLAAWPDGAWGTEPDLPLRMTANSAGFCTMGMLGGEIWSVGGIDQFGFSDGESYLSKIVPERCATLRSDVPWLSATPGMGEVAPDGTRKVNVTVDASSLDPGTYEATLILSTDDSGALEFRVPVRLTVGEERPGVLLSLARRGTIAGIAAGPDDVVGLSAGGAASQYFDGSDVGLGGAHIDAMARLPDGALILSFADPLDVPGIPGRVDDSDLVKFVFTSTAQPTAGNFELWFDGSDVGLGDADEDVDAVEVLPDGRILVSTIGQAAVPGRAGVDDSDVLAFTPDATGADTRGRFEIWFDGSDVGLSTADEDVDALGVDGGGKVGLSALGAMSVPGLTAGGRDVAGFNGTSLGATTAGTFDAAPIVGGAGLGLGRRQNISAFDFYTS